MIQRIHTPRNATLFASKIQGDSSGKPVSQTQRKNNNIQPIRAEVAADQALLREYGLRANSIRVITHGQHPSEPEKLRMVADCLRAYEKAAENSRRPNFSKQYIGACIRLSDGTLGIASNTEVSEDLTFCAERSAMTIADNNSKHKNPVPTISWLALSSQELGELSGVKPCLECQKVLMLDHRAKASTKIVTLKKNDKGVYLDITSLDKLLPYKNKQLPSFSLKEINDLAIVYKHRKLRKRLPPRISKNLLLQARKAYESNAFAKLNSHNTGVAVLLTDGTLASAARFDFTRRFNIPAEETAVANAFKQSSQQHNKWIKPLAQRLSHSFLGKIPFLKEWLQTIATPTPPTEGEALTRVKIKAIAYYGTDKENTPDIGALGLMAKQTWGGPDVGVITIEKDTIHVRKVSDFMPVTAGNAQLIPRS